MRNNARCESLSLAPGLSAWESPPMRYVVIAPRPRLEDCETLLRRGGIDPSRPYHGIDLPQKGYHKYWQNLHDVMMS